MLKKVQSMLSQLGLSCEFWAELVNTAIYFVYLSLSGAINFLTSFELSHKRMTNYSCLRIFGYIAYTFISKQNSIKLDATSKKCRFLEYASNMKYYKLWDPVACKLIVSRIVTFDELDHWKRSRVWRLPILTRKNLPSWILLKRNLH